MSVEVDQTSSLKLVFFLYIAYVIDNEDGTYTVSYQPIVRGNHQITVTMRSININGSPFSVNVTGRMDFAKVGKVMACFGCEGNGGGKILARIAQLLRSKPRLYSRSKHLFFILTLIHVLNNPFEK